MAKNKKRANGDGSIYQQSDGRWVAALSLGSVGGKRIRKKAFVATRTEARTELKKMIVKYNSASDIAGDVRVSELLDRWLINVINRKSRNTIASYENTCTQHIVPTLGKTKLRDLTPHQIRHWLASLNCGKATAQKAYDVLGGSLRFAIQEGLIGNNPIRDVQRPAYTRTEIFPFSLAETKLILATDSRYAALLRLILSLGPRQGEVFGLQWKHINFDEGTIRILRQASEVGGIIEYKPPKTKAGKRTLAMDSRLFTAMNDQRKEALRIGKAGREDLVFLSPDGSPIRRNNFARRVWKPLLTSLGLDERGLHHGRHTAATLMLLAGVPITVVSGILGHAKPSITLNLYSHYIPEQQELAVKARENYLG